MTKLFLEKYGPWAVVTGASDGLGRAVAAELAQAGLNLVLVARSLDRLKDLAQQLESRNKIQVRIVAIDLGSVNSTHELAAQTNDLSIGLLVAAAGFGTSGEFVKIPIEDELNMLSLNCRAVLEQAHHFGKRMVKQGRGGMILYGSLAGFQGGPYLSHYAATKAYVQTLAEGLHFEMKPHGVDVLAVAPGPVATGFGARAKMRMDLADNAESVARSTLQALGNQVTVHPGWLAKVMGYSMKMLSRSGRVRVMTRSIRKMVNV